MRRHLFLLYLFFYVRIKAAPKSYSYGRFAAGAGRPEQIISTNSFVFAAHCSAGMLTTNGIVWKYTKTPYFRRFQSSGCVIAGWHKIPETQNLLALNYLKGPIS